MLVNFGRYATLVACLAVTPSVWAQGSESAPVRDVSDTSPIAETTAIPAENHDTVSNSSTSKIDATMNRFKEAQATHSFFDNAYGYAVFPTVGKGGFGLGGSYGEGQVFRQGVHVGETTLAQLSFGLQLGAQAYSEIIFFETKADYYAFTSGSFEFGAQASAVAITLGASAQAGSTGAGAQAGDKQSKAAYINGMSVFTLTKGGLMYEAAIGGQGFTFAPNDNYDNQ
ncbi:lipid-binding SYLF domain-containing protein [Vibrio methylphosphonaticus]|uniref:lipid-binding SYLF domain-containing protein n=1 Tax=Vibrio methylphosphonaticus TaxID=2946866 RepID=UPI00202A73A8|nr:YSC84-related protein [Vibrio methylphosphonaticus]MCL9773675.1 YSC84-related protein [Vibrio methylphosphonaticus]